MKKLAGMVALLMLLAVFIVACGGGSASGSGNSGGNTGSPSSSSSNTVNLTNNNFSPTSITIKKGDSITLNNQAGVTHIISNGSWNGNTPSPKTESGAPVVSNLMISSPNETKTIGPFNTAGTFHYYCSVHPGMNLTVTVQ